MTALACDGQSVILTCPEEQGIKILSAFWGRSDTTTCALEKSGRSHTELCQPTEPSYPAKKLSEICDKKALCDVNASEAFFETELCPKVAKYLNIRYDCRIMSGMGAR